MAFLWPTRPRGAELVKSEVTKEKELEIGVFWDEDKDVEEDN